MKGESKILYSAPVAEIISLNQEDVICTSPWLKTVKKLLGGKKWRAEWSGLESVGDNWEGTN